MAQLMIQLDSGQVLPLAKCYWLQSAPCGCVVSLITPINGTGRVLATPEDAHKHLVPLKRERAKDVRDGLTWGLVTHERYHTEIAKQWECEQHRKPGAAS